MQIAINSISHLTKFNKYKYEYVYVYSIEPENKDSVHGSKSQSTQQTGLTNIGIFKIKKKMIYFFLSQKFLYIVPFRNTFYREGCPLNSKVSKPTATLTLDANDNSLFSC